MDYISDYDNVSTQSIEFGENLLDFSRNTDVSDIATVFIPLGAKLEESPIAALEQRLTIESVNNGSDSLVNLDAVKKFGYIAKTITWDEVTTPKMLLYKANKYIADYQWDSMTLEVNAVDMHWTDADVEQFKLRHILHCMDLIGISHCRKCQYSLIIYPVVSSHLVL